MITFADNCHFGNETLGCVVFSQRCQNCIETGGGIIPTRLKFELRHVNTFQRIGSKQGIENCRVRRPPHPQEHIDSIVQQENSIARQAINGKVEQTRQLNTVPTCHL
jgi:hypothetical protein